MENRVKKYPLDLFADRTSAATMRANQARPWFASFAYVPVCAPRGIRLAHTRFATATRRAIRPTPLKIGTLVGITGIRRGRPARS
jgi:hypothetical protein